MKISLETLKFLYECGEFDAVWLYMRYRFTPETEFYMLPGGHIVTARELDWIENADCLAEEEFFSTEPATPKCFYQSGDVTLCGETPTPHDLRHTLQEYALRARVSPALYCSHCSNSVRSLLV